MTTNSEKLSMKKNNYILIAILAMMILFPACHKDDEESPDVQEPSQEARTQIMTVFAPGQLGDLGYADRILKGVNALQGDKTFKADVEFMTSSDMEALRNTLLVWAAQNRTSSDGTPYSRRLLVMTELYMAKWFADITGSLQEGDEVLILKTNESDVKKAAEILGPETHVYGLNISAASAVRKYAQIYKEFLEACHQSEHTQDISLYRLYGQATGLYRDSVMEALQEVLNLAAPPASTSILEKEGELYDTDIAEKTFKKAYQICATQLFPRFEKDKYDLFSILDFGVANSGANFYLMGMNADNDILPIMLDGESRAHLRRYAITRHFDKALVEWVRQWIEKEPASMPLIETHGGWDGYCTEDIDEWEIAIIIENYNETL